jgi:hypothetical protein
MATENKRKSGMDNEPAPTRPTWKMAGLAGIAVLAIYAMSHWPEISALAHLPEIAHALGIG